MYIAYTTIYLPYTMPKILVDKNELESIRENIDNLLKVKEPSIVVNTHPQQIYKQEDFTEKEKLILKYVKDNPGTTKQGVVNNLHRYSRMPIFKTLNELVKEGMIVVRVDEFNTQIHHLFINNENILVSLIEDLDSFKKTYFNLMNETKSILKSVDDSLHTSFVDGVDASKKIQQWKLIDALLLPYKSLIITSIIPDFLWHEEPIDKETFHKKFAVIYGMIHEIQTELYESITIKSRYINAREISGEIFNNLKGLSVDNIYYMLEIFEKYGLSESAEAVLDCIWKICFPVLPIMDTSYYHEYELEKFKDWRKMLAQFTCRSYPYVPKTTQNPQII